MKRLILLCLAVAACPDSLFGGPIYGSISYNGGALRGATVTVTCAGRRDGSVPTRDDGSYRVIVQQEGRCTMTVSGTFGSASGEVVSSGNAAKYNFAVVRGRLGFELRLQ